MCVLRDDALSCPTQRFLAIAAVLATAVSAADEFCCRCQTFEDHKAFCTHLMGGRDRIAASELLSNGCVGPTKWPELDKKLVPKAPLCLSKVRLRGD